MIHVIVILFLYYHFEYLYNKMHWMRHHLQANVIILTCYVAMRNHIFMWLLI